MAGCNEHGNEPSGSEQLSTSQKCPYTVEFFNTASLNKPQTNPEVPGSLTLQVRSQASTGLNGGRRGVGAESLRTALTAGEPLA
jgi:hypothetical protein